MAELGLLQLMSRKPGWDRFHLIKDICDDVGFLNTHMGLPLEIMGKMGPCKEHLSFFCFGVYFRQEESHPGPDLHRKRTEETNSNAELVPTL